MADGENAQCTCAVAGPIVPRRRTPIAQLDRPFAHVFLKDSNTSPTSMPTEPTAPRCGRLSSELHDISGARLCSSRSGLGRIRSKRCATQRLSGLCWFRASNERRLMRAGVEESPHGATVMGFSVLGAGPGLNVAGRGWGTGGDRAARDDWPASCSSSCCFSKGG